MPRYYFHLHHKGVQRDEEGTELASDVEAWRQGVLGCSELMHDLDGAMETEPEYRIECVDEADRRVFTLRFSAERYFG